MKRGAKWNYNSENNYFLSSFGRSQVIWSVGIKDFQISTALKKICTESRTVIVSSRPVFLLSFIFWVFGKKISHVPHGRYSFPLYFAIFYYFTYYSFFIFTSFLFWILWPCFSLRFVSSRLQRPRAKHLLPPTFRAWNKDNGQMRSSWRIKNTALALLVLGFALQCWMLLLLPHHSPNCSPFLCFTPFVSF
jgi:hypothetical protein